MSRRLCIAYACLAVSLNVAAQTVPASSPGVDRIRIASRAAATIFRGTVTSIVRVPSRRPNQLDVVEVQFHVDEGLRGATTGSTLCIREWAGLWTSNDRYRIGEHVALFLYPPSRLGLTSPVAGDMGRFPVDDGGRIVVDPISGPRMSRAFIGRIPAVRHAITSRAFRQTVRSAVEN